MYRATNNCREKQLKGEIMQTRVMFTRDELCNIGIAVSKYLTCVSSGVCGGISGVNDNDWEFLLIKLDRMLDSS